MASKWYSRPRLWLEVFLLFNLAGLAPDILLAHSFNDFRRPAEYIPLLFSLAAPGVLLVAIVALELFGVEAVWRLLGNIVGWASLVIGVAGTVLHLQSGFFQGWNLDALVYAAPFAAPLAYAGLGLLLVMNRMVAGDSVEWPRWVLLFALGGFVGNFVFSVTDHAINGFYHKTEWIPVASSAVAIGFLLMPLVMPVSRLFLTVCAWVMATQGLVGLLGSYYHIQGSWHGGAATLFGNLVSGPPVLAPLLFADLMLLGLLGLAVQFKRMPINTHSGLLSPIN